MILPSAEFESQMSCVSEGACTMSSSTTIRSLTKISIMKCNFNAGSIEEKDSTLMYSFVI